MKNSCVVREMGAGETEQRGRMLEGMFDRMPRGGYRGAAFTEASEFPGQCHGVCRGTCQIGSDRGFDRCFIFFHSYEISVAVEVRILKSI